MPPENSASELGLHCSDAWEKGVRHLLQHGEYSPSVRGPTLECLNFTIVVERPCEGRRLSSKSPHFLAETSFSQQVLEHPRVTNWSGSGPTSGDGVDQVDRIVKLLVDDPLTRRAVVGLWDPRVDLGIANPQGVIALIFTVRSRLFHLTSIFRTTDAWMANWTLMAMSDLQAQVLDRLVRTDPSLGQIELGPYAQFHASFHIYLDDVPQAKRLLPSPPPPTP